MEPDFFEHEHEFHLTIDPLVHVLIVFFLGALVGFTEIGNSLEVEN